MKITFLLPPLDMTGGQRVVAIYASLLRERGHDILVVCPPRAQSKKHQIRDALAGFIGGRPKHVEEPSHIANMGVPHVVLDQSRPITNSDLFEGDVVIATWWETAEWVAALAPDKGTKVYFVQHHEVFPGLPLDRVRATYRLPLRKIVVARWLAEVMAKEYGDSIATVVPNGVDHAQFFAPRRSKQDRPTVGFIYSPTAFKGVDVTLAAIDTLRGRFADLRVIAFGSVRPQAVLPTWVEFHLNPPQDEIRHLYAMCDVWLTASWSEGFNLPAMEAMSCRTPVVSTRTGWPEEAIVDGVNGALVEPGDATALAAKTHTILGLPEQQWQAMSEAAFDTVRHSTWDRSADQFEAELAAAAEAASS